jgi:hypothetical protein
MSRRSFVASALAAGALRALPLGAGASSAQAAPLTLLESMRLAGQHLLTALNPQENHIPYFILWIKRDLTANFEFTWPSHNIGRWIDALLRLENATGFPIPHKFEAAMVENLKLFFDNPDNLLLPPAKYAMLSTPPNQLEIHSSREALLALTALVRFRNDRWAAGQAHRMMETLWRVSRDNGDWDYQGLEAVKRMLPPPRMDPTQSHGRLIEALVWHYQATGDALALKLANRFARYHLENTTHPDGTLNLASHADHTHSYLGTLRGLILFGELTNQREYIERVAPTLKTYIFAKLIKPSGAIAHGMNEEGGAEPASAGDVVQIALWLSRLGYPEFLDDVERLVRSRLVPAQITTRLGLKPAKADGADEHTNLDARVVGAFRGMHEPYGSANPATDITCAVLHTLVDVYQHIAVEGPLGLTVNLHFDYEDGNIRIRSERGVKAKLTIAPERRENLALRIPGWTPRDSVKLTVNGQPFTPTIVGKFACVPRDVLPASVVLEYDLPLRKSVERVAGKDYTLTWKGDGIIGISPNVDFLPMYPTARDE